MATFSLYDTRHLMTVLETKKQPYSFLLDTFFTETDVSMTEYIDIDIVKQKRKLAPFVSPMSQGKVSVREGYTTHVFKPAYVKPKRVSSVANLLKRLPGENPYAMTGIAERAAQLMVRDLSEMDIEITRREEWMAAQALTTGKVVVIGEGVNAEVDFLFSNTHKLAATDCIGAGGWAGGSADPLTDLDNWQLLIAQDSGLTADIVIMGKTAWRTFIANTDVIAELNRFRPSGTEFVRTNERTGAIFQGVVRGKEVYTYNEWAEDSSGVEQPLIADDKIVMGSRMARCVRHYGAIQDLSAPSGLPVRVFAKSWEEEDPSVRYVMLQSAPLPVPHEVDAFVTVDVIA